MSDFNRGFTRPTPAIVDAGIDAGLRSFMLGVYNKVGLGLVLSAALAWVTGTYQPVQQLLFTVDPASGRMSYTILGMVVAFAPLAILLAQMFMRRTSPQWAAVTYWAIVSLIGASFGMLFMIYSDVSIFQTFLVTAAAIGVLIFAGLIAYDTQRMKATYYQLGGNEAAMSVATSYGALSLYLDFINLFRFLLYFMGGSRR
jgi:FtsH-binding integral membrane protein